MTDVLSSFALNEKQLEFSDLLVVFNSYLWIHVNGMIMFFILKDHEHNAEVTKEMIQQYIGIRTNQQNCIYQYNINSSI